MYLGLFDGSHTYSNAFVEPRCFLAFVEHQGERVVSVNVPRGSCTCWLTRGEKVV